MKKIRIKTLFALLASFAVFFSGTNVFAGGPLLLFDSGVPYAWGSTFLTLPIPYLKDQGPLGPLTNAQADALTDLSMTEWNAVATSTFLSAPGGDTPFDLDASTLAAFNATVSYLFNFHGSVIDVVYDDNGSICANIFGCPPGVLGLGGFVFIFIGAPEPASGLVLMNGATVNPGDGDGEAFRVVFTQEVGHAIGLHHDQTNGAVFFFGDNSAPGGTLAAPGCPSPSPSIPNFDDMTAMYPFASISPTGPGEEAASIDHPEDLNSISRFYPDPGKGKKGKGGYAATTVTIVGTVFASDGVTPVDGVNIITRKVDDPFEDARSTVSGDLSCTSGCVSTGTFPDAFTGTFILTGLEPGQQYTLAVDNIVAGSFPQTPAAPFLEEFWNGTSESSNPAIDDRCDFVTISGSSGDVIPIVVILNNPPLPKSSSSSGESLPTSFGLDPNFPNPFNPETKINYQLPEESNVVIKIFNLKGQLVRTLLDEFKSAGVYTIVWNGRNASGLSVPTGTYIYQIKADNFQQTRKMVLLK